MNTITINDKEYKAKPLNFNALCYLESIGIDMNNAQNSNLAFLRGYIAFCMGVKPEVAGDEISEHVEKYGWESLTDALSNALSEMQIEGFSVAEKKVRKTTKKA